MIGRFDPRPALARSCPRHNSGQSIVEFLVLALVLLPLFLIVPLLGKQLDIAQTAAGASRYVAFEGMVRHGGSLQAWKSDAQLADEVRRRFFSASTAPVKTGDVAGNFSAHRNPFWTDHRGEALLPSFTANVGAASGRSALTQPTGAVFAAGMGLDTHNLHTGTVRVKLADVARLAPFDALGLSIERHTTVLVDPWSASGPAAVRSALRRERWGLESPFPFGPLEALTAPLKLIPLVLEGTGLPDVGRIDPDIVPADRLR
ncbi:MAG TPA: hypothetical protein DCL01_05830 [Thauera sp.]|nr:hypothetical protein [Thauera sp.]HHW64856.1 hypothetical protein [Rhodocyclaceae bacterium]